MFLEIQKYPKTFLSIQKHSWMFLSKWLSHYIIIKNQWRLRWFLNFARKKNFLGLLIGIRIFRWKTQLFILFKSSFKFFVDKSLSNITEKRDVPSANSLGFETRFWDKSFIYIKKSSGSRIEPWGNPASTLTHVEFWPFRTSLCFLSFRKSAKVFSKLPATPFCFNL